jgi:hypothetical protein
LCIVDYPFSVRFKNVFARHPFKADRGGVDGALSAREQVAKQLPVFAVEPLQLVLADHLRILANQAIVETSRSHRT